ncbi:Mu-like prophage major head subunit gpT family protein [Methylocystis sp. WRRC1]|uniref:prohead protease/major capsid protein fusion protein n=1 Tax=Methylocystis sp. WRRC1 TaxID=1732014 RepID=UPI001D15AF20|nr:prohead protease/major capsid protein fusion protein [Methylocystis sp. WRRC1]MCC3245088.1 Mu-like prophage major head subunit gpT family protein [Methylocystis sp. WRRC1]
MTEQTIIIRRASRSPSSWNAETRTFDIVLSTGAAVMRFDMRGAYEEILSLNQQWPASVPLLDAHNRETVGAILGSVSNIRTIGGEVIGTATLSKHGELAQRIAAELSDGGKFSASIGYRVTQWTEEKRDGKRAKIATKYDLLEVSLVVIPADATAGTRARTNEMTETIEQTETTTRAEANSAIRSIAEIAGLDRTWCDAQIDAEVSVEDARAAAFEAMKARGNQTRTVRTATVGFSGDDPEFRRAAMAEALYVRSNPTHQPSDAARQFCGLSMVEMARDLLRSRSISTIGLSPAGVIDRAMAMTTSDFPLLLADVVNKELRASYSAAPSGIKQVARMTAARDFRARHRVQVSGPLTLEKVGEHGEFKAGAYAESRESYSLETFGRVVAFSRQAIVNDSLGGLSDPARMLGRAAAEFEAAALVSLITTNPTMSDNKAVFHTDHDNLAGSGATIDATSLSAARLAMRTQTGLSGEPISVTPKYLIVGPAKETSAETILATISPVETAGVNPFAGKLQLIVEPRLSGNQWYLAADPAEIDGLEFAHLEGEGGPQVASEVGFDVDAVRFRVRLDFGGGWIDHRGWFKNPGA